MGRMKEKMIDVMNDVSRKLGRPALVDKGPLAAACEDLIGAIRGAKKRGIFEEHRVFQSCAVVMDSMDHHRQALYAAVDLVNYLESSADPHQIPTLIKNFKQKALQARLGQFVPRLVEEVDSKGNRPS